MTLKNVAVLSGCSVATVSKVFKNSPEISEETKQRVLESAEKCGYLKKATSRAAMLGGAKTVIVADPGLRFTDRLSRINTLAETNGLTVLYSAVGEETARSLVEQIGAWGLVILGDVAKSGEENIAFLTGDLTGLAEFFASVSTYCPKRAPRTKSGLSKTQVKADSHTAPSPTEQPAPEEQKSKKEEIWLL